MKALQLSVVWLACLSGVTLWAQSTLSKALLVLAKQDQALEIVDPVTLKVMVAIPAGPDPHEVVAAPDGKLAFVSNYGGGAYNTITVVDLLAQKPLTRVDLGALRGPHGLAYAGGKLYFTAEVNKVIGRYDPVTQTIDWVLGTGQNRTHMIVVSKNLDHIFTSNVNSGTISIIEKTSSGGFSADRTGGAGPEKSDWDETVIQTGRGTEGFDVSPDEKELWSADAQDGTVSIIDLATKKVVRTLQANVKGANRLKFTPDGRFVLVSTLFGGGDLAVFDTSSRRELKRVKVGRGAAGILLSPEGTRAYVACSPDNYVAVIDLKTLEVVGHIDTRRQPDGLAWVARQ
ncbi:MAG TPA: cytochrome D1 domain-containing protein [Terriglobales bacterium]|nr:cytochrome D1 domain-containing protein [Terriglobales bacterium]